MQREELIETITAEVLKRLDKKEVEPQKKKLLLTDKIRLDLSPEMKAEYETCFLEADKAKVSSVEIEEIIITKLDMKLLIELSELIQFDPRAEFILTSLLKGKNIYVLTGGVKYYQYQAVSPHTLYNKLMEAEDKLKSFGVEFLSLKELEQRLLKESSSMELKNESVSAAVDQEYFLLDKKLIDYSIVKNIYEKKHNKIEISDKSIVTALAKDFIKDKNISLKIIEGR